MNTATEIRFRYKASKWVVTATTVEMDSGKWIFTQGIASCWLKRPVKPVPRLLIEKLEQELKAILAVR